MKLKILIKKIQLKVEPNNLLVSYRYLIHIIIIRLKKKQVSIDVKNFKNVNFCIVIIFIYVFAPSVVSSPLCVLPLIVYSI